jgi:hypothetical protein
MTNSKVPVTLRCSDPMAELLLLDHRFHALGRGVGQLQLEVEPGMYLARAIAGNRAEEQPVAARPDAPPLLVNLAVVPFDSPIPLADTLTTHEYQQGPVFDALRPPVDATPGSAGGVLLCVRDPSQFTIDATAQAEYEQAYRGFRLLAEDGRLLLDYDALPGALRLGDRLLLHKADLPAANYQLERQPAQGPTLRLPLIVPPGLNTQLYVLVTRSGSGGWVADLANAAVAFGWSDQGFEADSPEMRFAERARYSLARGANLLTTPYMDELLRAKFKNPMLGLLGAHLMLLDAEPDFELLEIVLGNTAGLLGNAFPDVIALQWKLGALSGARQPDMLPVSFPPLLRRSWDYLVEASSKTPELIPPDSFAYRVSSSLVSNGIWVAWRPPREATRSTTDVVGRSEKLSKVRTWGSGDTSAKPWSAWVGRAYHYLRSLGRESATEDPQVRADRDRLEAVLAKVLDAGETQDLTAAETHRDPLERARDLVEYLVRNVDWEQVIRHLRRRDTVSRLSAGLRDLERALLPVLQFARRHLEDGGALDDRFVEGMARSLAVPVPVLLDGLLGLARELARIALGKDRADDDERG